MQTEKRVTAIREDGAIVKGMTMRGPGFILPVILTLEDGTEVKSTIDNERKKNLPTTMERKKKSIAAKAMKASFNDKGEFWGTVESYSMGGGGLEPEPMVGPANPDEARSDANNVGMGHEEGGVVDNAIKGVEDEN